MIVQADFSNAVHVVAEHLRKHAKDIVQDGAPSKIAAIRARESALIFIRLLVLLGLIPALAIALCVTANQFEASRKCQGAFSQAFSNGFDRYRCAVVVRHIGTDFQIQIPLWR